MENHRKHSYKLTKAAQLYLDLKSFKELRAYYGKYNKKESTEHDHSLAEAYLRTCPLEELPLYINHPGERVQTILKERLE